jgi:TRAP-type C4-dicarboxylate transport system permease small subunit
MLGARARSSRAELRALALAAIALALLGIVGVASATSGWHSTHAALGAPAATPRVLASIGGVVLAVALLLIWAETPKAVGCQNSVRRAESSRFAVETER